MPLLASTPKDDGAHILGEEAVHCGLLDEAQHDDDDADSVDGDVVDGDDDG